MNDKTKQMQASTFATLQGLDPDATLGDIGTIGPYKLLRELGRGGMGTVYLARHSSLQRLLAVKVLPRELASSPERVERFRREMAAIGRLEHPNIVLATDAGETDGTAFLAMQYLDGIDMSAVIKSNHRLRIADVAEVIRQAAVGLQHILESGLVHRDVKPSNLFLTKSGEIKILDLGLAMLRENEGLSTAITTPNAIMGTPDFIAPEQINASRDVDIRADIYSLGCTFYALLAGKAPFEGQQFSTTTSKLVAHAEKQAASLKSVRPDVPDALVQMVQRMMAKAPADRFAQPKLVADALVGWSKGANLQALIDLDLMDSDPTALAMRSSPAFRSSYLVLFATLGGAALLIAALIWFWPRSKVEPTVATAHTTSTEATSRSPTPAVAEPDTVAPAPPVVPDQANLSPAPSQQPPSNTPPANAPPVASSSIDSSLQQISKSAQSIEATNQQVEQNTRKIAQSIDELLKQLNSPQKKPVSDPQTPGEHYYNALVYGMQGNPRLARQSYLAYFDANQDFIDPHLKFIETLTLQEGKSSLRELYKNLPGDKSLLSRRFAEASLLEESARTQAMQALAAEHPSFAPAWWALSSSYSVVGSSGPTLHDVEQEKASLKRFLSAHAQGGLLKYYLNALEASTLVTQAESRLKTLEQNYADRLQSPVFLNTAIKVAENWQVTVEIAEPVKEIFYRVGEMGEFQSLGKSMGVDPATALPLIKKSFMVPGKVTNTTLFIRYLDMKDHTCGPYSLAFDSNEQTRKWETQSVQQLKPNWLRLMEDRLFFDVFHAGRSVLKEVRYGVDVDNPNRQKPVPKAALGQDNVRDYFEAVPQSSKYAVVQLVFVDGTESEVVRIEKR